MFHKTKISDAAALSFLVNQAAVIEREVNRTVYPEVQYPFLVPVDSSAPDWADTVGYITSDMYGKADWINPNADDIPMAGTDRSLTQTQIHTAAIGYGFGLGEIEKAMMMGINLQADEADAARRAYEEMVDRVAMVGEPRKGFVGLINNPNVIAGTALHGDWNDPATTVDQILADVAAALIGQYTGTLFTTAADTLLLPTDRFLAIGQRRMGPDNSQTVLEYIRTHNVYTMETGVPLTIRGVRSLNTAGAGGTARMVAYLRNPQTVKIHIPMPHRFLEVYKAGPIRWQVPGIFRLGGTEIRKPRAFSYVDGI